MAGRAHDPAERRRTKRAGRERGCWLYIAAEQLAEAGVQVDAPPPEYRVWPDRKSQRGRFVVTLYPATNGKDVQP